MRAKAKSQPHWSYDFKLNPQYAVLFETWEEWAFAEILESLEITWEYESLDFLLQVKTLSKVDHLRFKPDFYLPEHNMIVEITRSTQPHRLERKNTQVGLMGIVEPSYKVVLLGNEHLKEILQRDGARVFADKTEFVEWLEKARCDWEATHSSNFLSHQRSRWLDHFGG